MRWVCRLLAVLAALVPAAAQSFDPALSIGQLGLLSRITAYPQGNIILMGQANDCSLPVVNPINSCGWLWIAKLDPTGSTILFATYFGPPKAQAFMNSIAADAAGNIVVLSEVSDNSLPAINAIQSQPNGRTDLYIFKLAGDGSRVIYATYLGGSSFEIASSLAVDGKGAAYILLDSGSPDFPSTPQSLTATASDKWVIAKLAPDGQSLAYAASFPKSLLDSQNSGLQVDASGAAFTVIAGEALRLAPDGSALQRWPLPAWANNKNPLLVPAGAGGFWLVGNDKSQSLPVTPDAFQAGRNPAPYFRIEDGQTLPPATPLTTQQVMTQQVSGFAVDPFETWRVYAATDAGLFKSEDNGWTWQSIFFGPCVAIAVDPFDQNDLYVTTSPAGVFRSTDRGQNWVWLGAPFPGSVALDPNVQGLLYGPGYRSEDGGTTWKTYAIPQPVNGPCGSGCLFSSPLRVWTDPVQTGRIYVLIQTKCTGFCPIFDSLLRSDDGGRTFAGIPAAGTDLAVDSGTGDLFTLGGGKVTVYRNSSLDTAEVLNVPEASAIAVDPSNSGTVYLALTNGSILRSSDGGRTWSTVATVPTPATLLAVSIGGVLNVAVPSVLTDVFAFRFDGAANVVYGTYFGGWNTNAMTAAVSLNGHLFLAGNTRSGLPVSNAPQAQFAGGMEGFVAEFDVNGALLRSTYLGGGSELISALIPQNDGSVIVAGYSNSQDFLSQLQPSAIGGGTAFLVRLRP